ncbi:IS66 family transposase [Clostridium perfringens]|uniref:IS66 family transposase n=1 Tax=Clostridium perfringens TaxID=1502 RepID=UPI003F8679F8
MLNKNKKIFGASSEKVDSNQLSLFDEAEKNSDVKVAEPKLEEITYKRKKASHNGKKDNLANLERVVVEHKLKDDERICSDCNGELTIIGSKSKEILKYIPAKLYIEEHITYSYACKNCENNTGDTKISSTKSPKSIIHKSMASNELLSHVIVMKYLHSLPLYRQENYFKMLGANLSRQTLSNWIIGVSNGFEPIYSFMKEKLLKSHYIQADETTLKVINDNGSEAKSKKYMWLYKNCSSKRPIILYDYQKTRSSSCPKNFLKDFSGYLQTDGYSGYNSVCKAKRLYCLAHIRRKYHEIIINLNEEALKKSRAIIGFNFCEQIYKIEKEIREEYSATENFYKKRKEIRNKKTKVILEKFEEYVQVELENALPKSPLGKALEYTQKFLPKMKLILEDSSLEIDNNAAERAIKPFVIGRKNWLFSNTPKGAASSATLYSIIETAKANNLIVEKYLIHLMNSLSEVDIITDELLEELMPWNDNLPKELRIVAPKKQN